MEWWTPGTAAVAGIIALSLLAWKLLQRKRLRFIERYRFPPALTAKLRQRHPEISNGQTELVLDALRQWFVVSAYAKGDMIGMPSRVVDDAWHEFILMTRLYHSFCTKAFGRYLHHTPNAVADEPVVSTIPRTLELLQRAGFAPAGTLPELFTIDADLRIEGGRRWTYAEAESQLHPGSAADGCLGGADWEASDGGCSCGD
jgi:hypothetical protein